ncbi:MAG: hypothetical protein ACREGB_05120 [Candidatus Saccharimonadales bacterium]
MTSEEYIQFQGRTRVQRFQPHLQKPTQPPQAPSMTMKTNARNQYRGHGRGQ